MTFLTGLRLGAGHSADSGQGSVVASTKAWRAKLVQLDLMSLVMTTDLLTVGLFSATWETCWLCRLVCVWPVRIWFYHSSTWLNGTNMPSFSGPWQDNESSLRNLASCCDLYNSTVCAWGWWGLSMTVLIEQICITKYIFMYLSFPFCENRTKLHKVKVLSSL